MGILHGRWVIAAMSDMAKLLDFLHILTKAYALAAQLNTLTCSSGLAALAYRSRGRCQEEIQLLLRFTAVRAGFVADLVDSGLSMLGLRDLHLEFVIICSIYAHDSASFTRVSEERRGPDRHAERIPHRRDRGGGAVEAIRNKYLLPNRLAAASQGSS